MIYDSDYLNEYDHITILLFNAKNVYISQPAVAYPSVYFDGLISIFEKYIKQNISEDNNIDHIYSYLNICLHLLLKKQLNIVTVGSSSCN